ncbi:NnrU family protein [Roseivivax sediminis]|uniref:Uncharacterized membrane protein n=1 Tax=Roseivivax sediminis TaxID=936889 RepID=A0A1I2B5X7_9RHOB|nr:NnrU family protein [Roseivivax sediminis]SFE51377.1 Uncharacterized membrane protein [Roseivivax sediminis]
MTGWIEYATALSLFAASHFVPRLWGLRERLIGAMGRQTYFSVYGLVSVALLAWLIAAAGRAPYVELWPQPAWARWVPNIAMPVSVMLIAAGIGLSQPYTLGARKGAAFDPARPGVAAISRHPLFLALALWAGSHLPPNGDLAHVLLFGSFLAMALAAIPAFDARARRALEPETARAFFAATSMFSLRPLGDRDWRRRHARPLATRAVLGLALWLGLLHLHTAVIGASPFPF